MLSEKFYIIIGVVVIGVIATLLGNGDLSAVALGGLVGYLSKDVPVMDSSESVDGV